MEFRTGKELQAAVELYRQYVAAAEQRLANYKQALKYFRRELARVQREGGDLDV